MRQRLPLVLSATALLVALLGATPLGNAAGRAIRSIPPFARKAGYAKTAGVALNAKLLNGHRSSTGAVAGTIPVLGPDGKLPASIGAVGPQGPAGPQGPTGANGSNGATNVVVRTATAGIPAGGYGHAIAACNSGERATGGGVSISGVNALPTDSTPNASSGSTPTSWFGQGKSTGAADTIKVYVVCASP